MSALTSAQILTLLAEYGVEHLAEHTIEQIKTYLQVFEVWSKRVSLTTVREAEQVVRRHFGESFALARVLPETPDLLDLGSGAGFPGIPIALFSAETKVTLAESQSRKAAFLRESTQSMQLNVEVWSRRAEGLIGKRQFGVVTLRAVDDMAGALAIGARLLRPGGSLAYFVSPHREPELPEAEWAAVERIDLPGCAGGAVLARLD